MVRLALNTLREPWMSNIRIVEFSSILALAGFVAASPPAFAEDTASPPAAAGISCLPTPAKLSEADMQSFFGDSKALLTNNAVGGLPLSNAIRSLAGSNSLAFDKIKDLTKDANPAQRSAIAAGLARVVYVCGTLRDSAAQDYAAAIQAWVAGFGDTTFAAAFQAASKDIDVAAVGPGVGGYAAGGGATTDESGSANTNQYTYPSEDPSATTSGTYTIGSVNPYSSTTVYRYSESGGS